MSDSKSSPNDLPVDVAFALAKQMQGIGQPHLGKPVVLLNDLVAYAYGEPQRDRARIARAIATDATVAARFEMLVTARRRLHAPTLVAAQTDDTSTQRQGHQFVVKTRASKASPSQVYVILEFDALAPVKDGEAVSVLVRTPEQSVSVRFPAVHDRRTQLIDERDSQFCTLLGHPDAQISIL